MIKYNTDTVLLTRHVDKELRSPRFWTPGVGHAQRARLVADLGREFVGNAALTVARVRLSVGALKGAVRRRSAGARAAAVGVLGVGTAKLVLNIIL